MLIAEYVFNTIKNNIPALTVAGITHVYPKKIKTPEVPEYAVIVNELSRTTDNNVSFVEIQLTCIAKSITEVYDLAMKVDVLFDNKIFSTVGDPVSTKTISNIEGVYDEDRYLRFVTIRIVSHKEKLAYL